MMLDSIDEQVPNATQLINEYAQIVKNYLQEQLDIISQDKEVIAAFEAFLKQVPAFLERPVKEKVTLDFSRISLINEWSYYFDGYLENYFSNPPEKVMNAIHNGYLLNGYKFRHHIKNMPFILKNTAGSVILTTNFEISLNNYNRRIRVIEMTDVFDD